MNNNNNLDKYFKLVCYAEGFSCFLLFLVAMPLKYMFNTPIIMIPSGIIHGFFFTAYLILAVYARKLYKWDDEDFVFALMSAFFPFATIWVEKKLTKLN
ncbi:DUF3817 domain-containing protein [Apibacter muscae]|uniref:DUF3817 domain-containing protein n=1 Tax=Apibacter muscae TaxID=2509004 RepID=UPI0011AD7004|nr:DUF3817 domain-containing protein [Apibacter muscae]TWP24663.1 DUF3817 domain-containing protein [Apibacter muscae]